MAGWLNCSDGCTADDTTENEEQTSICTLDVLTNSSATTSMCELLWDAFFCATPNVSLL